MTDNLDELHAQAGLALLVADVGMTTYDGQVPNDAPLPYVLVYTTVKWPKDGAANMLDTTPRTIQVEWNCHCVGETAAAARAIQMRVRAALLDKTPTIAGRNCNQIAQDDVLAPNRDETTGRLVMDGVSNYSTFSVPG